MGEGAVLMIEPRASNILGKCSTAESYPPPILLFETSSLHCPEGLWPHSIIHTLILKSYCLCLQSSCDYGLCHWRASGEHWNANILHIRISKSACSLELLCGFVVIITLSPISQYQNRSLQKPHWFCLAWLIPSGSMNTFTWNRSINKTLLTKTKSTACRWRQPVQARCLLKDTVVNLTKPVPSTQRH